MSTNLLDLVKGLLVLLGVLQVLGLSLPPVPLSVLLSEVSREGAVVGLVEQEVLQLLVVVQGSLQLLQLGRVLQRVLLVAFLKQMRNNLVWPELVSQTGGQLLHRI